MKLLRKSTLFLLLVLLCILQGQIRAQDLDIPATDSDIRQISEELCTKDDEFPFSEIQIKTQGQKKFLNSTDEAEYPLFLLGTGALTRPTIQKLLPLFDNYESDTLVEEHVTEDEQGEENEFLDAIMGTEVMRHAMLFLEKKGRVSSDPTSHRELIRELWLTRYPWSSDKVGSSGFEHVFVHAVKNGTIIGLSNWIYFHEQESKDALNYLGYLRELVIPKMGRVLKVSFTFNDVLVPEHTLLVGTSPELEMALYTVCFLLRPNQSCVVSMYKTSITIKTFSWKHNGKDYILSAYPEIQDRLIAAPEGD